jgi:hypothetical protein
VISGSSGAGAAAGRSKVAGDGIRLTRITMCRRSLIREISELLILRAKISVPRGGPVRSLVTMGREAMRNSPSGSTTIPARQLTRL